MGEEMNGGGDEPPGPVDWARIRQDYETGVKTVAALAAAAGLCSWQELAQRAKREGWKRRHPARPKAKNTRDTIGRLKQLLQQRLADLEGQIGHIGEQATAAESERDIRAMNTLVRTLEKVLELERKDRAARAKRRRHRRDNLDAERDALSARLEALHRERLAAGETA